MPELGSDRQIETSEPSKVESLLQAPLFLERLQKILPSHLTSERFAAIVMRNLSATPGLRDCTPTSLLSAAMDSAALGLEPGMNGESYLIPYTNKRRVPDGQGGFVERKLTEAQLQIGYLGHLKLAWNSGLISAIDGDVVTHEEVDQGRFEFQRGTEGYLHHKPLADRVLNEKTIAFAWAMVWLKGSDRPLWRVLDSKQIERLRNTGRSANSPAWKNHYDEMAMAKALKRTLKWAPKTRDIANAVALDDAQDSGFQTFNSAADIAGVLPPTAEQTPEQRAANEMTRGEAPPSGGATPGEEITGPPPQATSSREPEPVPVQAKRPEPQEQEGGLGWD